jgi:hypothetical protein
MSNQTFEEHLVRDCPAEPLEGHNVVVFERVGDSGEKFHTVLPPGTPLKRGLLGRVWPQGRFIGVAVDASPELHLDVSQHVVLEDEEAHRFDLLLDLYYSVGDPRLLASLRNRDPLRMIAERARQAIGRDVSQLQWTEIVYAFAANAQEIVRQRMPELKALAASFGIALRSVEVARLLPEEATRGARQTEADLDRISRDEKRTQAEMESARRLKDTGNFLTLGGAETDAAAQDVRDAARVQGAAVDARIAAIGQVASNVNTLGEFGHVFGGAVNPALAERSGFGARPSALNAAGNGFAPALQPGAGGLAGVLGQVVSATQNVGGSTKRLELRAALLHLVAEVLLEDLGDTAACARHAESARRLLGPPEGGLAPDELAILNSLADPVALGKALRN